MALVVLVVRLELIGALDDLLVKRVFHMILDGYRDRLIHLVACHLTNTRFPKISFHSFLLSGHVRRLLTWQLCP